jgi:hypothetical protein
MNMKLHITKVRADGDFPRRTCVRIAVVDSDAKKTYPSNFICMLPQHVSTTNSDSSVFAKTFGETRVELAKKLLNTALKKETDSEVKFELKERLKMLEPKPVWQPRNRY